MRHFCTYFDTRYLTRALALYHSLRTYCPSFVLWSLCIDEFSAGTLERLGLEGIRVIRLTELERDDAAVRQCRQNRTYVEYCYTLSSVISAYLLRECSDIDMLTYLDSDLFFFSSPAPIYAELGEHSIAVVEHRFPAERSWLNHFGRFNVGLLVFRRDSQGLSCVRKWREQCIDWCYARVEGNKYADQKYLDEWPARYSRVKILCHKGVNLAPWNIVNYSLSERNGRPQVDDVPVVCFHFHGLRRVAGRMYKCNFSQELVSPSPVAKTLLVRPYVGQLSALQQRLNLADGTFLEFLKSTLSPTGLSRLARSVRMGDYLLVHDPTA